jgi:hypothetical protein
MLLLFFHSQQPGMQAHSSPQPQGGRGRGAGSSSGGRRGNDRGRSRYNPYWFGSENAKGES